MNFIQMMARIRTYSKAIMETTSKIELDDVTRLIGIMKELREMAMKYSPSWFEAKDE